MFVVLLHGLGVHDEDWVSVSAARFAFSHTRSFFSMAIPGLPSISYLLNRIFLISNKAPVVARSLTLWRLPGRCVILPLFVSASMAMKTVPAGFPSSRRPGYAVMPTPMSVDICLRTALAMD